MFSRKTSVLVVLVFILAALIVYRVATREEPKRVRELTYKPVQSGQGAQGPVDKDRKAGEETAKAVTAKMGKRAYRGVIRNPFQPLYPPPPVVVPKPATVPIPAPFPVITAKGPSPAQMESGRFRFLGFLQKEGDRKIFLSRDKEIFIVKKGDIVTIFQVGDITENSVILISKDSREEFKLIIEEIKPTKPGLLPAGGRR